MEKYTYSEYPYGQFPSKFTKSGQKKYFQELKNNEQKISAMSAPNSTTEPQNTQGNFDIAKLLPLLKMMGDKKSMSSTDMLQIFLPLLGGGNVGNIGEIMSLMNNKPQTEEQEEDIEPPNTLKIDEYKRVE